MNIKRQFFSLVMVIFCSRAAVATSFDFGAFTNLQPNDVPIFDGTNFNYNFDTTFLLGPPLADVNLTLSQVNGLPVISSALSQNISAYAIDDFTLPDAGVVIGTASQTGFEFQLQNPFDPSSSAIISGADLEFLDNPEILNIYENEVAQLLVQRENFQGVEPGLILGANLKRYSVNRNEIVDVKYADFSPRLANSSQNGIDDGTRYTYSIIEQSPKAILVFLTDGEYNRVIDDRISQVHSDHVGSSGAYYPIKKTFNLDANTSKQITYETGVIYMRASAVDYGGSALTDHEVFHFSMGAKKNEISIDFLTTYYNPAISSATRSAQLAKLSGKLANYDAVTNYAIGGTQGIDAGRYLSHNEEAVGYMFTAFTIDQMVRNSIIDNLSPSQERSAADMTAAFIEMVGQSTGASPTEAIKLIQESVNDPILLGALKEVASF